MSFLSKLLNVTVVSALMAVAPRLSAQNVPGTEVSFRVLCFEHRDNVTTVLAPGDDAAKIEVPLFTNEFSDPLKARFSGGKAAFYVEEKLPDGKIGRKLVAEGSLGKGPRQAFVLIPTEQKTGAIYRIVAFDDAEESFPMGATRVINLAPFPIRLNLAGADMEAIKPGGIGVYPMVKKVDEWNMYTARIDFEVKEGQWVGVSTQSWKASERKRDWVVTRFDQNTKQPAIRLYQDIPPWRKQQLPAGADAATP
jgi:hypothetical protein